MAINMRYFYEKLTKENIVNFANSQILYGANDGATVSVEVSDQMIKLHKTTLYGDMDIVITPEKCKLFTSGIYGIRKEDCSQIWLDFRGNVDKVDYHKWVKKEQDKVIVATEKKKKKTYQERDKKVLDIGKESSHQVAILEKQLALCKNQEEIKSLEKQIFAIKNKTKETIANVKINYDKEISAITAEEVKTLLKLKESEKSVKAKSSSNNYHNPKSSQRDDCMNMDN